MHGVQSLIWQSCILFSSKLKQKEYGVRSIRPGIHSAFLYSIQMPNQNYLTFDVFCPIKLSIIRIYSNHFYLMSLWYGFNEIK